MRTSILAFTALAALPLLASVAQAQHGKSTYVVPEGMVRGGQFIHRFLPMKPNASLRSDVWGMDAVKPRDVASGVEDARFSYWCTSSACATFAALVFAGGGTCALDDNYATRWAPSGNAKGAWLQSDLGSVQKIERQIIRPEYAWKPCGGHDSVKVQSPHTDLNIGDVRHLKLTILQGTPGLWEFRVY